ncbi:MAG: hypothetical protein JW715_01285, partial [Sedimentisphaerales bacterium]|nr:hypothetical protein [Sedimentisphaerales bacterium]
RKQNWVVDKMREVDPDIVCIASGNAGDWSRGLLQGCPDHIDAMAEHYYITETLPDVAAHADQVIQRIRSITSFHRNLRRDLDVLKGKDIKIAMTEWNYWNYNTGRGRINEVDAYIFGELGRRYFMKDALGIAAGLHEYYRQSDIMLLATYAQTVNVIGCVKASKTAAAFETTGLVLKLYRNNYGTIPVEVTDNSEPIDVAAAWTTDRKALTIGIVNPTEQEQKISLDLKGAQLAGTGTLGLIANSDPMAYNDPEEGEKVVIEEKQLSNVTDTLTVPAFSISLYTLSVR